jgi:hypothetical protein
MHFRGIVLLLVGGADVDAKLSEGRVSVRQAEAMDWSQNKKKLNVSSVSVILRLLDRKQEKRSWMSVIAAI